MNGSLGKLSRCAIYTRKSTEHNLDLAFTSLDAQREAREAYITSQAGEGWRLLRDRYDDGAFSGAFLERPALQRLLADVRARRVDIVVVYKVDRLTRSLADFAKLIELFEPHRVSFVSVTQSFNTSSSMGRLTLKGEHRSGVELDGLVHVIAGAWGVTLADRLPPRSTSASTLFGSILSASLASAITRSKSSPRRAKMTARCSTPGGGQRP